MAHLASLIEQFRCLTSAVACSGLACCPRCTGGREGEGEGGREEGGWGREEGGKREGRGREEGGREGRRGGKTSNTTASYANLLSKLHTPCTPKCSTSAIDDVRARDPNTSGE